MLRAYADLEKSDLVAAPSFLNKSPSEMTWEEKEQFGGKLFREADEIGEKIT